jgi:putative ABC transport system permease protein
VVILSWELWQRRFASDALIVGRTIRLNREGYTVIGVMPASFRLLGFVQQLWTQKQITLVRLAIQSGIALVRYLTL